MFLVIGLFMAMFSFAEVDCLITKECMEHNGKIIDLRSKARILLDESNYKIPDETLPYITEKEFSKLTGTKGAQYFIPVNNSDVLLLAGALSLGVVVFSNDRSIMDFIQANKTETTAEVTHVGNLLGREAIAPIAAGAFFVGAIIKNNKLKKIGLFTVKAGLATQIVTEVFKKNFQRMRPNASDDPYEFFEDNNNSFFSGHTSGAFSLATVVAEVYKDQPIVPYLAYGAAALTAYARMHDNKHWASDVLAGAVAGHLITKLLIRSIESSERKGGGLLLTPDFGPEYKGIKIKWVHSKPTRLECGKQGLKGKDLVRLCVDEIFAD